MSGDSVAERCRYSTFNETRILADRMFGYVARHD